MTTDKTKFEEISKEIAILTEDWIRAGVETVAPDGTVWRALPSHFWVSRHPDMQFLTTAQMRDRFYLENGPTLSDLASQGVLLGTDGRVWQKDVNIWYADYESSLIGTMEGSTTKAEAIGKAYRAKVQAEFDARQAHNAKELAKLVPYANLLPKRDQIVVHAGKNYTFQALCADGQCEIRPFAHGGCSKTVLLTEIDPLPVMAAPSPTETEEYP